MVSLLRRILARHPNNCRCEIHKWLAFDAERVKIAALPRWRRRAEDAAQNRGAIPRLADGTEDFPGGPAIVGENGAEVVVLPPHTKVRPLARWVQRLVKRTDKVRRTQ